MDSRVLTKFGSGLIAVFTFNLISKLLSFSGNIVTVRLSDAQLLGEAFQFEVWVNTLLFLAREPIRNATSRFLVRNSLDAQHCMNCGVCSVPIFLLLSLVFAYLVRMPGDPALVYLYVFGGLLECIAEPYAILAVTLMLFPTKVRIEGIALLLRMVCTVALLFLMRQYNGGYAYAWAQVVYGAAILIGYVFSALNPRTTKDTEWESYVTLGKYMQPSAGIPRPMIITTAHMVGECILRLVLTEGEKVVLWAFASVPDMGVYRVVSHLVSIVCRLLFKFVEEVSFTAWSKLLSGTPQHMSAALHMLRTLMRGLNLFGVTFVVFGIPYAHTALNLLFGPKWANDPNGVPVMRAYCVYVLLLGVNGLLEAFFRAGASEHWLRRAQFVMFLCSCVYVSLCVFLMQTVGLGVTGLVWANCASMVLRIAYCTYFMYHYIPSSTQRWYTLRGSVVLSTPVILTMIGIMVVTTYLTPPEVGYLVHIGTGVICLAILVVVIWAFEKPLLNDLKRILRKE